MMTAGRTVQTVSMPIIHNDMSAGVKGETMTAIEPTKLIMVIAVGTSAPAKLAPLGPVIPPVKTTVCPVVPPINTPIGAIALAVALTIALAKTLAVGLPINLTVDLAFDPVSAIETAASRLGDRGKSADQSYGQRRSDDLAHPHCLSPLFCRVHGGNGVYASSTLAGE